MTDEGDLTLRMLSNLRSAEPDPVRAERVRLRCHAAAHRTAAARRRRSALRGAPERAAGAFTLAYVAAAIHDLLRWSGVR